MSVSRDLMKTNVPCWIRFAFLGLFLSGCSIIGLKSHITEMEARGSVTIKLVPPPQGPAPTYALAWISVNGQATESAGFQQVRADGLASFNLLADRAYSVGAFTDENRNGKYDPGEPLAYLTNVKPLSLSDPTVEARILKLTLQRDRRLPSGTLIAMPVENKALGGKLHLALGDVVSLDEQRFASDAGGGGLWRPLYFLSNNAMGIYFTEPYDPKRIPVLFVYGIGGSPQDMRYLMEHLDKKRYQCWFIHYPSGMRLGRVARMAATGLNLLRLRERFSQCYIVAHSMGGLVAYATIDDSAKGSGVNFIPKFISISTPWGGHQAAEMGIRRLKKPVPSWLDVAPNSDFLKAIYERPLPRGTRFDLIYGSRSGGPIWMRGENDGVVTVASMTDPRVKSRASSVTHLPYGHVDILNQKETLTKVLEFLGRR